jgi:hypothetical protein
MKTALIVFIAIAALGLVACDKTGTCEYKFDEASRDGSIPVGLEVCQPKWEAQMCGAGAMSAVTLGLKTSGYKFTKGATCEAQGYKDCSGIGSSYYKTCPAK